MNKFRNYRHLMLNAFAILSLWATPGISAPVLSAQAVDDISIKIVADRDIVKPAQKITYTITATNFGPDDAVFVDLAFEISDQLFIVSMSCDQGISPDGPFCEYSSLPSGASVVSRLVATPKSTAHIRDRTVRTVASILFETLDTFDPDTSNNTDTVKTRLIGRLPHP